MDSSTSTTGVSRSSLGSNAPWRPQRVPIPIRPSQVREQWQESEPSQCDKVPSVAGIGGGRLLGGRKLAPWRVSPEQSAEGPPPMSAEPCFESPPMRSRSECELKAIKFGASGPQDRCVEPCFESPPMRSRNDVELKAVKFGVTGQQDRADETLLRLGFGATPMKQMPVLSPRSLRKGELSGGFKDFGARSQPGLSGGTPLRACKILEDDVPEPQADPVRRTARSSTRTLQSSAGPVAVSAPQLPAQHSQVSGPKSVRPAGPRESFATSLKESPKASPKTSPKASPRASPRSSPRLSPRESRRVSPKASPRMSPRASPVLPSRSLLKASSTKTLPIVAAIAEAIVDQHRTRPGMLPMPMAKGVAETTQKASRGPLSGDILARADTWTGKVRRDGDEEVRPRSRFGGA